MTAFNASFIPRVKRSREAAGLTQDEMARALGIPLDRYKKYETRSPLPVYLIARFAIIARADALYLLGAEGPELVRRRA